MILIRLINNFRESLEKVLAYVLDTIDKSTAIDKAEQLAIESSVKYLLRQYGVTLTEDNQEDIKILSEELVKCLGKINRKISKQLKK